MPVDAQAEQALRRARDLLKSHRDDAGLHALMAQAYEQLGQHAQAAPHLAFLCKHAPSEEHALRYAKALQRGGEVQKAMRALDLAGTDSCRVLESRAFLLYLGGNYSEALTAYRALARRDPGDMHALAMTGALELLISDCRSGFNVYAIRPGMEALAARFSEYCPLWQGEALAGKSLLLWTEQGIGDAVMFAGFLAWLLAQDARITMVAARKLAPLVARSFPQIAVISELTVKTPGEFDCHLPLGELPRHGLPHYTPAQHAPYLRADETKTERLRARCREHARRLGKKRLMGFSWHTDNPDVGFARNVPLDAWKPLFDIPDILWVSLQYGAAVEALTAFPEVMQDPEVDAFDDLDALASQMRAMDGVITIDNATVHLAGALGVPATLLLSTMTDWRWGLERRDCLWYGSVSLERQEKPMHWQSAIKRVRRQLMASGV